MSFRSLGKAHKARCCACKGARIALDARGGDSQALWQRRMAGRALRTH